jgi:hydrogenase-4 component F
MTISPLLASRLWESPLWDSRLWEWPVWLMPAPVVLPLIGALIYAVLGWRASTRWVGVVSAAGVLAAAIAIAAGVTSSGPQVAFFSLLRVDALSAFLLIVIGTVALISAVATPGYLAVEIDAGRADHRDCRHMVMLVQVFLALMALAVLAAGLGVLWVAIEATTIVTAFLVGQGRGRAAVEAAWKYVVICSTGIALALLGTFLLNFAAQHTSSPAPGLDWVDLVAAAPHLDPGVTRIAVALLIVGFGTKAGLAPLHAWLPDAYSQAPAPVTALMSGVLVSVAFYAVLRVKVIADAALGPEFTRALLVVLALASLILAASLLLGQRDYERMLAYSSIENMGLVALGAAIGSPLAIAAVLLHLFGHGLVKSSLFLGAGRILQVTGTSRIDGVRGLAAREPLLAGCFGFAVLAIIAFPPFALFASELGMARAGFAAGMAWQMAAALMLVLVIAAALVNHTSRMLLGAPVAPSLEQGERQGEQQGEERGAAIETAAPEELQPEGIGPAVGASVGLSVAVVPVVVETATGATSAAVRRSRPGAEIYAMGGALLTCAVLGLTLGPLGPLLAQATAIVTRTP